MRTLPDVSADIKTEMPNVKAAFRRHKRLVADALKRSTSSSGELELGSLIGRAGGGEMRAAQHLVLVADEIVDFYDKDADRLDKAIALRASLKKLSALADEAEGIAEVHVPRRRKRRA